MLESSQTITIFWLLTFEKKKKIQAFTVVIVFLHICIHLFTLHLSVINISI